MNYKSRLASTMFVGLFLTACASTPEKVVNDTVVVNDGNVQTGQVTGVAPQTVFGTAYTLDQLKGLGIVGDPLNYKTIYFQYNSSVMDEKSKVIASAHARYLSARGNVRVTLEGHADERGTRDYNLALGERRAQTVSRLMKADGAGSINTISYGEERPVSTAHNDSAWSQNRRVVISY